jgi:hypothetical protein
MAYLTEGQNNWLAQAVELRGIKKSNLTLPHSIAIYLLLICSLEMFSFQILRSKKHCKYKEHITHNVKIGF